MRRLPALIAVTSAAVVATPSLADAAPKDRVTGRGVISSAGYEARVNAHSGPSAEKPRGSFSVNFFDPGLRDQKVKVTCMIVDGDVAIVGGRDRTGIEAFLTIQDNGRNIDVVSHAMGVFRGGNGPDQARCAELLPDPVLLPVVGNFTVMDA